MVGTYFQNTIQKYFFKYISLKVSTYIKIKIQKIIIICSLYAVPIKVFVHNRTLINILKNILNIILNYIIRYTYLNILLKCIPTVTCVGYSTKL